MSENEMMDTLSQVAKLKTEFDLLKRVIFKSLSLNYTSDDLVIKDEKLIIEIMRMIEPEKMENIFESLKVKDKEMREKLLAVAKEDKDNG